jgi:hypothetical protein
MSPPRRQDMALRLFQATSHANAAEAIFDEWTVVGKKGKRIADTPPLVPSKKIDHKTTPTKKTARPKHVASANPGTRPSSHQTSQQKLYLENGDARNPVSRSGIAHRPPLLTPTTHHAKKQAPQDMVCANRPQTWQQRLNVPTPTETGKSEFRHQPRPPQSPPKKLLAAGAWPGF